MNKLKIQHWQATIIDVLEIPLVILTFLGMVSKKIIDFIDAHTEVVEK